MASSTTLHLISVTLLLSVLMNAAFTSGLEEDEFRSMVNVLRDNSGYNLFGNAITTSELFYEVLSSGKTFTFFAPTDSSLFALDMTNSAADYTAYLRCHVIPVRLSFSELRRFPSGSSFPTLLKDNRIPFLFQRRTSTSSSSDEEFITVGGVRVTSPGLFYSRNLAVHGLAGTINCRSHQESPWIVDDINRTPPPLPPPPPLNSPPNRLHVIHRHPPPPPRANSSGEDATLLSSVPPRSQSQPELSSGSHISLSPILSQRQSLSPLPNSGRAYNHHMKSAETGSPDDFEGYSKSPINLPPRISPDSYEVWSSPPPEIITADSSYVPPPFEFSENDDPIAFPPSDFRNFDNQDTDKQQYAESELGSLSSSNDGTDGDLLISPQDYVPITSQDEQSPEETVGDYSDEIVRDCPRTDGFTQISFFPNMFCAKTPVQQPNYPSVLGVIHA